MRWSAWLRRRGLGEVSFCDRCGVVCDPACRSDRLRDQTLSQVLSDRGWR